MYSCHNGRVHPDTPADSIGSKHYFHIVGTYMNSGVYPFCCNMILTLPLIYLSSVQLDCLLGYTCMWFGGGVADEIVFISLRSNICSFIIIIH